VNDGGTTANTVTRTFTVTVNRRPVISAMTNQIVAVNSNTIAIPFTISDTETSANSLTVSATCADPTLVLPAGFVFAGSNGNRTLTIAPTPGQTGTADVTITVSDGSAKATSTFELKVLGKPAAPGSLRVVQALP